MATQSAASPPPTPPPPQTVGPRRRPLPHGRAVVGGVLVAGAAIAGFVVATPNDAPPLPLYGTLTADISAGTRLAPEHVQFVPADLPPNTQRATIGDGDDYVGAITLTPLRQGQLLDHRHLATDPEIAGQRLPSVHQLSIPVSTDRAPAAIEPGDLVTLLAHDDATGAIAVVVEDAVVLTFGDDPDRIGRSGTSQLTLALDDPADVIASVRWSYEPITVVLTTGAAADSYEPAIEHDTAPSAPATEPGT